MQYDLIIIGSGPAGYVSAIRAGQTGLKTLVIDKKYVGGMCLNWGCIPTKSLIESAKLYYSIRNAGSFGISGIDPDKLDFDWTKAVTRTEGVVKRLTKGIEYLWKKNGVEFLQAEAKILSPTSVLADNRVFEAKNLMIATGSKPAALSHIPDAVELENLLRLDDLPHKPVIYGRGAVAIELAQMFWLLGRKVTIVASGFPLIPKLNDQLNRWMETKLKKDKIVVIPESETSYKDGHLYHKEELMDYDAILNSSLRQAIIPLSEIEFAFEDGYLKTDEHLQTSVPGVYAVGDVNGRSYLAHAASAQGLAVVNHLQGKQTLYDDSKVPLNIYTKPEMAQIGMTEQQLKEAGIEYKTSEYPLTANGKALAEGNAEGSIRLLYETKYKQVLGVQIIAENATDMIAEAGVIMELEGTVYDLASTIHAHPTVSEVFMEAGSAAVEENQPQ